MATPRQSETSRGVNEVREFNRFYTAKLGILDEVVLESHHSLSEGRILHELLHHDGVTATDLVTRLSIDEGYLSRLLKRLVSLKLVNKKTNPYDRRKSSLQLTGAGKRIASQLNSKADAQVETLLNGLTSQERENLISALATIRALLGKGER